MAIKDIILSPATIWYAPVGETPPDPNSVGYGEDWGGDWENLGYTNAPLAISINRETYEVSVEQLAVPVKEIVTGESATFETTLVEFTGDNMLLAFGGELTETLAGVGQVGMTELETGGATTLQLYAFGFEGLHQDDDNNEFPIRIFVYKANAVLNGQLQFAKAQEAGMPLQIKAKPDTSKALGKQLYKVQKVHTLATS